MSGKKGGGGKGPGPNNEMAENANNEEDLAQVLEDQRERQRQIDEEIRNLENLKRLAAAGNQNLGIAGSPSPSVSPSPAPVRPNAAGQQAGQQAQGQQQAAAPPADFGQFAPVETVQSLRSLITHR